MTKDRWGLAGEQIAATSTAESSLLLLLLLAPGHPVLGLSPFPPHHPSRHGRLPPPRDEEPHRGAGFRDHALIHEVPRASILFESAPAALVIPISSCKAQRSQSLWHHRHLTAMEPAEDNPSARPACPAPAIAALNPTPFHLVKSPPPRYLPHPVPVPSQAPLRLQTTQIFSFHVSSSADSPQGANYPCYPSLELLFSLPASSQNGIMEMGHGTAAGGPR